MAFETIGQRLHNARINQNISLEELQQITKIQKKYLEALENDMYDLLPGTFYVRAFIRQYAAAVGEDGDYLVAIFNGEIDPYAPKQSQRSVEEVRESRKEVHEESGFSRFVTSLPAIMLGIVALGILVVVFYAMWTDKNSEPMITTNTSVNVEGVSSSTSSSTVASSTTASSSADSSTESSSSSEKKEQGSIQYESESGNTVYMTATDLKTPVEVTFTGVDGDCWLGIMVDGAYIYETTVSDGEKATTTLPEGATNATLVLGSANNVAIKINNQKVDFDPTNNGIIQKNIYLTLAYAQ